MDRIVGLDIGTTKICAIVAEVEEDNAVKITGLGSSPSDGLKRGVVVNVEQTVQSIRTAIDAAQEMSGTRIGAVYAGISGDHIHSVNTRAVAPVSGPDNEITPDDTQRVVEAAEKAVPIPMDQEIIHVLPQSFVVDAQPGIKDPVGMSGVRLEADVHIVTAAVTSAQNIIKSIRRAGLEVADLVLGPIASSRAVLTPDEEEMGVALIDIGGGTTDLAVFYDSAVRHTAVVGLGGTNVTQDMAIGLRTPWKQAETLKCERGCALKSLVALNDMVDVPGVAGRPDRQVSRMKMTSIIEARMEEIFGYVNQEIRRTEYANVLGAGIVLTGGGATLEGCAELAEEVFEMPATVKHPQDVTGRNVKDPVYSTSVGLLYFGLYNPNNGFMADEGDFFDSVFGRIINWIRNFF